MRKNKYLLLIAAGLFMPFMLLAQWESDTRLTYDSLESVTSFNNARCVAASGANIHVVWHDNRDGNTEIYHKRSIDYGTTWGVDERLTTDASWSERPSIALSDSIVHVVWYDGRLGSPRVFYKRSLDNGATWGPDTALTSASGVAYHPSVAVTGSIVHVVWTDMRAGPQIYYTRSLDNGTTWETDRIITPAAPAAGKNLASVAVSDSIVHVVWMDMRASPQTYYTRSFDNGVTWETDKSITPAPSQFPSVAVLDSIVHVAYADFRHGSTTPQIYYTRSLDNGTTWETETQLAENYSSWYPSIAASSPMVHVAWPDNRNGDTSEIYYKCSADNGASWGADIRLTDNLSESREPSIVVSDSMVHAVWHDSRDANWEIYYKRNPTGNLGIAEQEKTLASLSRSFLAPSFFSDKIILRFDQERIEPLKITLYDIRGVPVFSSTYAFVPSLLSLNNTEIRHLASGVYFLCIDVNKQIETQKLIKLK